MKKQEKQNQEFTWKNQKSSDRYENNNVRAATESSGILKKKLW